MKLAIHRGQQQIGGNIVEIATDSTRILFDAGSPLDAAGEGNAPPPGFTSAAARCDAAFFSHYHGDHIGLWAELPGTVPIYLGERAFRILAAADQYCRRPTIRPAGWLRDGEAIRIGDIAVTPFLCDHSAFDSYMLLAESGGERILYTGDFRGNGRKSFAARLATLPQVDKLICEGTTLSREADRPLAEAGLESRFEAIMKQYTGPVLVLTSAMNIDRIVTIYRAALKTERLMLQDLYMANITAAAGGHIPRPERDWRVRVFITRSYRPEDSRKFLFDRFGDRKIGRSAISKARFVMCVRDSMAGYLRSLSRLMPFSGGVLVYSLWEGYKRRPGMQAFLAECADLGLETVSLHTSGHADAGAIAALIARTRPREIHPIHTENAAWFRRFADASTRIFPPDANSPAG